METRASGVGGGEAGSAGLFVVAAEDVEASRPKRAPAAASVPSILRRVGTAVASGIARGSEGFSVDIAAPCIEEEIGTLGKDSPI